MQLMNIPQIRLTSLAHGGGCGCKLAPSVLQQLLADQPATTPFAQLLVGTEPGVHAITDVTGFGLLGHGLEMARGSELRLVVRADDVPLLSQAAVLAERGFVTGASHRNWSSYGNDVELPLELPEWRRHLLTDPQTSGGLLVAVAPERGDTILRTIRRLDRRTCGRRRPRDQGRSVIRHLAAPGGAHSE
jgi:selenophosphate synthase